VQLVSPDIDMTALAEEVVGSLGSIHKAESKAEMANLAEQTREFIEHFVATAAKHLTPASTEA
jgi:hypothetical protein